MIPYRKDIDGLRGISVLAVILFHAELALFSGGFVGVDIFFVISGFLITSIILKETEKGTFSLVDFYERRIRRIFPALFFIILITTLFATTFLLPPDLKDYGQSLASASLSVSNIFFWWETGYFSTASFQKPLLHTWSLAVEEQFYAVFPLFIMLLYWGRANDKLLYFLLFFIVTSLGTSMFFIKDYPEFTFYFPITRAWELLLGSVLALPVIRGVKSLHINNALSILGGVLVGYSIFVYSPQTQFPGMNALVPCLGAVLIIYTAMSHETFVSRMLSLNPIVFVGRISYSLYLWHWPIFSLYAYYKYDDLTATEIIIAILLSFVLATLSWKFVEQPFRGKGALASRKGVFFFAGACVVLCFLVGVGIHAAKGFPGRYSDQVNAAVDAKSQNNPRHAQCLLEGTRDDLPPIEPCRFGFGKADEAIAIWGDSHADHFVPGIEKRANSEGFTAIQITKSGCAPLIGAALFEEQVGFHDHCITFNEKVMSSILNDQNIKTVILAARWSYYAETIAVDSSGSKQKRYLLTSDAGEKIQENSHFVFKDALEKTVLQLIDADKKVIIIGPVPEMTYKVPDCLARALSPVHAVEQCEKTTRETVDKRNKIASEAIDALKKRYSQLEVFMPVERMCGPDQCELTFDNNVYYMDDNHLSSRGAEYLSKFIKIENALH